MTRRERLNMKRFIAYLIMAAMLVTSICAYAEGASTTQMTMQQVLLAVKGKIDIPPEADKFESNSNTDKDGTIYDFSWHDEDRTIAINIECDGNARIKSYNIYKDRDGDYTRLSSVTREQAKVVADEFIRNIVPENFENTDDCFVYDEYSSGAYLNFRNSEYWFSYERIRNGAKVKSNDARVQVEIFGDSAEVTSFNCDWDYKTEFADGEKFDGDLSAKYIEQFPAELVYEKEYPWIVYRKNSDNDDEKAQMIYRIKDNEVGYISSSTGEKVTEDPRIFRNFAEQATADAGDTAGGGSAKNSQPSLTEAELKEVETAANFIKPTAAEKTLRSLGELKLTSDVRLINSSVRTDGERYYLRLYMGMDDSKINPDSTNYHNLHATLDAQSGEIISISNYTKGSDRSKELTDAEKDKAAAAIDAFAKKIAGKKLSETGKAETETYGTYVSAYYPRFVNGIEYVNDGVSVGYDSTAKTVNNYNLTWDTDVSYFDLPEKAISADDAYKAILDKIPLEQVYIITDGKYRLCTTLSNTETVRLDAISGELIKRDKSEPIRVNYGDIDGHWSETAVRALSDVGIALPGDDFRPDDNISLGDMMRLMAATFWYGDFAAYDDIELADNLADRGIITRDEAKTMDFGAAVSREESFVYMIKFMGYEKIAKMNGIFKCDFADGNLLSADKIGYAALLSGFGVVSGDGGLLRPNSYLTRGETAAMIYNYLTKN